MNGAEPVRLAVVGVGHLGRHHARVAARLPGVALVGVHDHHEGRAEEVARESGLRVLSGPEEVADAAEAVVVATPTSSHGELGRFFLGARPRRPGGEADRLGSGRGDGARRLARRNARVLAVGHVERYNPAVEALLATAGRRRTSRGTGWASSRPRSLDVDVVLDLMIHDLQIVSDLVRRPVARSAPSECPS